MDESLVPTIGSMEAKRKHEHEVDAWTMFARRAQRHPYVKTFVFERDGGVCRWCSGPIKPWHKSNIHHVDYDHCCTFPGRVEIPVPTEKRPGRRYKGPDCQQCHTSAPEAFSACMSRLVLVHAVCNAVIDAVSEDEARRQRAPRPSAPHPFS